MNELTPEIKFNRRTKIALVALTALIIGPLSFFIALSVLGITAAIGAGALALFVVAFINAMIPAASQYLTQLKYKAFTSVVSRSPIEALYSEQEDSYKDLQESNLRITEQMTEVEVMRDKVDNFAKTRADDPESVQRWRDRLIEWEKVLAFNLQLFDRAKVEYVKLGRIVEDAELEWDMAATDRKLSATFGKKDDFMRRLRSKTALETVQRESAAARARLKMSLVNNDYAISQTKDQPAVHAINYDQTGKIVTGNLLKVEEPAFKKREGSSE